MPRKISLKASWSLGKIRDTISFGNRSQLSSYGASEMDNVIIHTDSGFSRRGGFVKVHAFKGVEADVKQVKEIGFTIKGISYLILFFSTATDINIVNDDGSTTHFGTYNHTIKGTALDQIKYRKDENSIYLCSPEVDPFKIYPKKNAKGQDAFFVEPIQTKPANIWNKDNFPNCMEIHENRLILMRGNEFWASKVGDFTNFERKTSGANDDDAIYIKIKIIEDEEVTDIVSLTQGFKIFTTGGEYLCSVQGITIKNIRFEKQSSYGSEHGISPVDMNGKIIFKQKNSNVIRNLVYLESENRYTSSVLGELSDVVQNPVSMDVLHNTDTEYGDFLICVNDTGDIAVLSTQVLNLDSQGRGRPSQISRWVRWTTDGEFKSCIVINDYLYVRVDRKQLQDPNDSTNYIMYWERYDLSYQLDHARKAINTTQLPRITDNIQNVYYSVIADRIVYKVYIKADSTSDPFTRTQKKNIEYGLPYYMRVESLAVDSTFKKMRFLEIKASVIESDDLDVIYEGDRYNLVRNKFSFELGRAEDKYTGILETSVIGYTENGKYILTQDQPLDVRVQAVQILLSVSSY